MINGTKPKETAVKFWNISSISEDEGEITLYGDVMSKQPTDWWTGEPEPGLYITPEGFMEDLAAVKGKAHVTVKLNSCGGDLYTGIAIHNALKALDSEVNVVVEGIAASAASVIMCAGDTVTVYPGSLVMIHGVSVMLWDYLNIGDMKQLIKGMDASERAVAEIYNAKTGIEVDTLRSMMTKETWLTGREAIEKGFADTLNETKGQNRSLSMTMSADKKILFVNGISHNIEGLRNLPKTIPLNKAPTAEGEPKACANIAANSEKKEGGGKMDLKELKETYPDLVAQIEKEATETVKANTIAEERKRLQEIESIAAEIGDPEMVEEAKYGDKPCTAQELSFAAMQKRAKVGAAFLNGLKADADASGTKQIAAAPAATEDSPDNDEADIQAVVGAYAKMKGGN
jgi:ATP-dependent protease ClpP protease subunit